MKFRGVAKLGIKASGGNYDQAVLSLNPTAFWKFDEDASPSVYADSSGNGHDLTFEQGVLRQTPLAKGSRFAVGGDAIGRITQGDPDNLPSMSTVSIGTWLNGNTLDQIDHILSMDDDVGNDRSFQFRTNGLLVEWIIVDTAGADTLSSSSGYQLGRRRSLLSPMTGLRCVFT